MIPRRTLLGMLAIILVLSLIACASSEGDPTMEGRPTNDTSVPEPLEKVEDVEKPKEPYTMFIYAGGVSPQEFDDRFRTTLENKFPHITFKYSAGTTGETIRDWVAQGEIPDIIRTDIPTLYTNYLNLELGEDLTPWITKKNYSLDRFVSSFIDEIREAGQTEALYGLPVPPYYPMVLFYNKDIFDKYGVDYPEDGIKWDELYSKVRALTREDGGMNYRGFSMNVASVLRDNPFSISILDPIGDHLSDSNKWRSIFEQFTQFYSLSNNIIEGTAAAETGAFAKGNVAMQMDSYSIAAVNKVPKDANWDIVSYPVMNGAPEVMGQRGPAYWSLTKQGKNKDEAFDVIIQMLTDDIQMSDSLKGAPVTVVDRSIQEALGKGHEVYSTKNMQAIYYYPPAKYAPKRQSGIVDIPLNIQQSLMRDAFFEVASGQKDVNTALRELDEKLKQELEKEKNK